VGSAVPVGGFLTRRNFPRALATAQSGFHPHSDDIPFLRVLGLSTRTGVSIICSRLRRPMGGNGIGTENLFLEAVDLGVIGLGSVCERFFPSFVNFEAVLSGVGGAGDDRWLRPTRVGNGLQW